MQERHTFAVIPLAWGVVDHRLGVKMLLEHGEETLVGLALEKAIKPG